MKCDIRKWTRECLKCQSSKIIRHTKSKFGSYPKLGRFTIIHLDIVGPLPSISGKKYLFTMIDRHTSWPGAIPIADITGENVAKIF